MSDFTQPQVLPLFFNLYSPYSAVHDAFQASTANPASSTWPAANKAFYFPFFLPWSYPVNRVFWGNGSTLGNADIGIYTADGTRIYNTASTAQSGASALQFVTPGTTFVLSPARYYLALTFSGTTTAFMGFAGATTAIGRVTGMLEQATALPLPATATFAAVSANFVVPCCGFTLTTTGY